MIYWTVCKSDTIRLDQVDPTSFLSPVEQARLVQMRFPKRRREWLLGRWTAKKLLWNCAADAKHIPLQELAVLNDPQGAPYFTLQSGERLPMALSISHREGSAMCAFSTNPGQKLGVDIERIEARDPVFLEDYFTEPEKTDACMLNEQARVVWVTAAWSLKESVLKALGKGLRVDTRQVELSFFEAPAVFAAEPQDWVQVGVSTHRLGDELLAGFWRRAGQEVFTIAFSDEISPAPLDKVGKPGWHGKDLPHDMLQEIVYCPILEL